MNRQPVKQTTLRAALFFLAGGVFILALIGFYRTLTMPQQREVAIPILQYRQLGQFDYTVRVRPSSLYDGTEFPPRESYFAALVDSIRMNYTYHLETDQPLQSSKATYQVNAVLSSGNLWEKRFVLIPATLVDQSDFSFSFNIFVPEYLELIRSVREETGAILPSAQFAVTVQIQPEAQTSAGVINQPMEHTLQFVIDQEALRPDNTLQKVQPGAISQTVRQPITIITPLRILSGVGLGLSILLLAYVIYQDARTRQSLSPSELNLIKARKQIKGLLISAPEGLPSQDGQYEVHVGSLSELLSLAEETLRPVIYWRNGHGIVYYLLDGTNSVRYNYCDEQPSAAPQEAKPNG